ncbi:MAG: hypothetical protein ACLFR2_01330 [Candidatus Kapaibacterium sp.]
MTPRLLFALIIALFIGGCVGERGPTGPRGEGNAEIRTFFYNLNPADWQPTEAVDQWFIRINEPFITASVTDNGAVLCYYLSENGAWSLMPITNNYYTPEGQIYSEEFWFSYFDGFIDFDYRDMHPTEPLPPGGLIEIKAVIIENWSSVSSMIGQDDIKTYDSLEAALNLKNDSEEITE